MVRSARRAGGACRFVGGRRHREVGASARKGREEDHLEDMELGYELGKGRCSWAADIVAVEEGIAGEGLRSRLDCAGVVGWSSWVEEGTELGAGVVRSVAERDIAAAVGADSAAAAAAVRSCVEVADLLRRLRSNLGLTSWLLC